MIFVLTRAVGKCYFFIFYLKTNGYTIAKEPSTKTAKPIRLVNEERKSTEKKTKEKENKQRNYLKVQEGGDPLLQIIKSPILLARVGD